MNKLLDEGTAVEDNDPSRVQRLRVSAFPFCGVKWFFSLPSGTAVKRQLDTKFKFYTSIGTAVHECLQEILNRLDLSEDDIDVIADWECKDCKHLHKFCVAPTKCSKCRSKNIRYRELTVEDGNVLGHVDTVIRIKVKKSKGYPEGFAYLVLDYKTSSVKKVGIKSKLVISESYMAQIRSYVTILHHQGHAMLPFAVLVYIPRDDPDRFRSMVVPVEFEAEYAKIKAFKKQFKVAVNVADKDDLRDLIAIRPCAKGCLPEFEWCKWRHHCAGPDNAKVALRELDAIRIRLGDKIPIVEWKPPPKKGRGE